MPIPTSARSVPPAAAARPFFAGVRSDPYAALLELFVALPLFSYGVFELGEAVRTTKFVLNDPRPYLVSDARIVFDRHAFAAVHYLPALVLVALALFVRRRDPYTRPLVVALFALALGSAHVNAVMSFYGAALGPIGVLAIALALRPNSASSLVATIFATLLFSLQPFTWTEPFVTFSRATHAASRRRSTVVRSRWRLSRGSQGRHSSVPRSLFGTERPVAPSGYASW